MLACKFDSKRRPRHQWTLHPDFNFLPYYVSFPSSFCSQLSDVEDQKRAAWPDCNRPSLVEVDLGAGLEAGSLCWYYGSSAPCGRRLSLRSHHEAYWCKHTRQHIRSENNNMAREITSAIQYPSSVRIREPDDSPPDRLLTRGSCECIQMSSN